MKEELDVDPDLSRRASLVTKAGATEFAKVEVAKKKRVGMLTKFQHD